MSCFMSSMSTVYICSIIWLWRSICCSPTMTVSMSTNLLVNRLWNQLLISINWRVLTMFVGNLLTTFMWNLYSLLSGDLVTFLPRCLCTFLLGDLNSFLGAVLVWNLSTFLAGCFHRNLGTVLMRLLVTFRLSISMVSWFSRFTMSLVRGVTFIMISGVVDCVTLLLVGCGALLLVLGSISFVTFCVVFCFTLGLVCLFVFCFVLSTALVFIGCFTVPGVDYVSGGDIHSCGNISAFWSRLISPKEEWSPQAGGQEEGWHDHKQIVHHADSQTSVRAVQPLSTPM